MKRSLIPCLILFILLGCESVDDQDFEPEPNILALMRIGDTSYEREQNVKVDQSYDIQDTVDAKGLRGSEVKILSVVDTFLFADSFFDDTNKEWQKYNEGWYGQQVKLNDTTLYSLEVVMPWGDTVTGEAYIPSPIQIYTPADSDTVSISQQVYDPLVITWNSCKNTQLYMIACVPDVDTSEFSNYSPFLFLPSMTADTSYTFFLERMIMPWSYYMYYVLRVMAVSPEYADYMGMQGPTGSVSNLSSGYGMFGGTSEDSIRVYIVE